MIEQRIAEVTKANQRFYEAFESLDITKMDEVWAHLGYVTCIHPGWALRSDWLPSATHGFDSSQHFSMNLKHEE